MAADNAPIKESITLKVFGEWAERQRAELFQSKQRLPAELETKGCCNPGLELANTFGVIQAVAFGALLHAIIQPAKEKRHESPTKPRTRQTTDTIKHDPITQRSFSRNQNMQAPPTQAEPKNIYRYPCPACGADLLYEPSDGSLTCPHCGHNEAITTSAEQVEERSFEQYLQIRPEQLEQLAANALEVRCQSCGATVTFIPPQVAGQCDFCGVQIVAQAKFADPILAPEGVLPFRITQQQASAGLRQWLESRWFAPNALKHFAQPDSIDGVYLPFWTYDTDTTSQYTGERGDHYYVTETYYVTDSQGNQVARTREVQHTRWSSASGRVSRWFDDILVPATAALTQNRLEALEPWDLAELRPYEPAFLSGFKAQRYQVDLAQGFERVKQVTAGVIQGDVRKDIGGNVQRIHNVSTHYSGITFKHLLLPVYAGAYRFNQKVFQIVVNGRTGEIQGDRPYSFWKIALFVTALLFMLLIVVLVFGLTKS